jgi:hypothetical protein
MTQSVSTEVGDIIVAGNKKFMETYNGGDAAGLANLYTESSQLLPTGSDFVSYSSAIEVRFQNCRYPQ